MVKSQLVLVADTSIKIDKKATVELIQKTYGTKRQKLNDLRHHLNPQKLECGRSTVNHVPTSHPKAERIT